MDLRILTKTGNMSWCSYLHGCKERKNLFDGGEEMTKEVLVTISGIQFSEEPDGEPIEVITSGDYYKKNGKHYVIFDEIMEGSEEAVKNTVKITESSFDITKRGGTNVHLQFEKDKNSMTHYYTPYGSLLVGTNTRSVEITETDHDIHVMVDYELQVNYEHMADCKIVMDIKAKHTGDFKIER